MPFVFYQWFGHDTKFVPKLPNFDQKQHRINIAQEILDSVRDDPHLLQRVRTGDHGFMIMTWKPKLNHSNESCRTSQDLNRRSSLTRSQKNIFWSASRIGKKRWRWCIIIGCQKSLAVFPQACLCKRVVLVVFVASVHARAFWNTCLIYCCLFLVVREL